MVSMSSRSNGWAPISTLLFKQIASDLVLVVNVVLVTVVRWKQHYITAVEANAIFNHILLRQWKGVQLVMRQYLQVLVECR